MLLPLRTCLQVELKLDYMTIWVQQIVCVCVLSRVHNKSIANLCEGRGLSPWLYSVETVIMSFIHTERNDSLDELN